MEVVQPLKPHLGKYVQYQVREIPRYIVTRYEASENQCGSEQKGEYDNELVAYEVAYALCKAEHDAAGTPPDDVGFAYPKRPGDEETESQTPLPD